MAATLLFALWHRMRAIRRRGPMNAGIVEWHEGEPSAARISAWRYTSCDYQRDLAFIRLTYKAKAAASFISDV